jgi:hypothetical protein
MDLNSLLMLLAGFSGQGAQQRPPMEPELGTIEVTPWEEFFTPYSFDWYESPDQDESKRG